MENIREDVSYPPTPEKNTLPISVGSAQYLGIIFLKMPTSVVCKCSNNDFPCGNHTAIIGMFSLPKVTNSMFFFVCVFFLRATAVIFTGYITHAVCWRGTLLQVYVKATLSFSLFDGYFFYDVSPFSPKDLRFSSPLEYSSFLSLITFGQVPVGP